jgi:hypothetical protein
MSNGGELKRVVKYKRVVDPSDPDPKNPTSWIDVPCIIQIGFLSPEGQLYVRKFDSTQKNNLRKTHTVTVKHTTKSGGHEDGNQIAVERIDEIQVRNGDWYEYLRFSNDDANPSKLRKTHVLRYNQSNKNDPNEEPWVDVAVIDEFTIKGFLKQTHLFKLGDTDASQVTVYKLKNDPGQPLGDDDDPNNPKWGDNKFYGANIDQLPLDTNGNPDPVRLDPFQNIVNVNWGGGLAVEFFDGAGGPST